MSRKFVENAAGAFMIKKLKVKRWDGFGKLEKAAAKAAKAANANPEIFEGRVKLLGQHHADLMRVKALYMKAYTLLYKTTMPFERGEYLIATVRVPELEGKIAEIEKAADEARDAFLEKYDSFIAIAKAQDMGDWESEVSSKYPDTETLRDRFGIEQLPPRPVPVVDMKKLGVLSVEDAERIAADGDAVFIEQLEKVKAHVIAEATKQMKTIIDQLEKTKKVNSKGEEYTVKLFPTLITNARQVAANLRDLTTGYDNDSRLIALADEIDAKIGSIESTAKWKESTILRKQSLDAAKTVRKGLRDYSRNVTTSGAPANKSAGKPKGKVVGRGLMGKKMRQKADNTATK
jgi:hypothetical protein